MGFEIRDAGLKNTTALPNGATSTSSAGIDTRNGTRGTFLAPCEILLTAPAMNVTQLPNGETVAYIIEMDTDSAFGSPTTLFTCFTQTGAGGAGAAANTFRARLPTNVERYVRVKATKTGTSNPSALSSTLELLL